MHVGVECFFRAWSPTSCLAQLCVLSISHKKPRSNALCTSLFLVSVVGSAQMHVHAHTHHTTLKIVTHPQLKRDVTQASFLRCKEARLERKPSIPQALMHCLWHSLWRFVARIIV